MKPRATNAALFALALLPRVAAALSGGDPLAGVGFEVDATWAPFGGPVPFIGALFAALLGAGGALLFAELGRRLDGARAGLIAAVAYAVWPTAIVGGLADPKALAAGLLLVAGIGVVLVEGRGHSSVVRFGLAGGLLGLASSLRPSVAPASLVGLLVALIMVRAAWSRRGAVAFGAALGILSVVGVVRLAATGAMVAWEDRPSVQALARANPNDDGRWSPSLPELLRGLSGTDVTTPGGTDDQRLRSLASEWTALSPELSRGLLLARIDRLVGRESAAVASPALRSAPWSQAPAILADSLWFGALALASMAPLRARPGARRTALGFMIPALGLAACSVLIIGDGRDRLVLGALVLAVVGTVDFTSRQTHPGEARGRMRRVAGAVAWPSLCALLWGVASLLAVAAERLLAAHRWAASLCFVDATPRICAWRKAAPMSDVWDRGPVARAASVSAALSAWGTGRPVAALATHAELPAGRYQVSAELSIAPALDATPSPTGAVSLRVGRGEVASVPLAAVAEGAGAHLAGEFEHPGGVASAELLSRVESMSWSTPAAPRLVLSNFRLARAP